MNSKMLWILGGCFIVLIVIMMVQVGRRQTTPVIVEGFTSSSRKDRENFLGDAIRNFGMTNNKKNNRHTAKNSKLASLKPKGSRDDFKNVSDEIDSIDLGAISVSGISDTLKRYNENFNNRLEYARKKNNNNDMEMAMAQWDVLTDEFKKLFIFSDYI